MTLKTIAPDADYLTPEQVAQLLRAINTLRVGKDGKNFSHVQAYECRAHLNRILGFARWSEILTDLTLIFETQNPQNKWTVCYRATIRVTVCAPNGRRLATYSEASTGEAINQPSRGDAHDLALKTAQSQAFKRCLVNLGDQFGNSLYGGGSLKALTGRTLLMPEVKAATEGIDDEAVAAPVRVESEVVEDQRETNPKKATEQPRTQPEAPAADGEHVAAVAALRDRALGAPEDASAPFFARLQMEAAKAGLMKALTDDGAGNVLTLGALIQQVAQARKNKAA